MNLNISDILSYAFLAAGLVSLIAGYMKQHDKKHEALWTDLQIGASAIVAQQDVMKTNNEVKKATATAELIKQMNGLGHKNIDVATAGGAIEKAVNARKTEAVLDDLQLEE